MEMNNEQTIQFLSNKVQTLEHQNASLIKAMNVIMQQQSNLVELDQQNGKLVGELKKLQASILECKQAKKGK